MHGIVVVDKPAGMTSAAVVARVKRVLHVKRIGHTGTLDPMATGVLPLCVGEGTKLAGYLLAEDKTYEGELELGVTTDTLDADGEVTGRADASSVTEARLADAIAAMVGEGEQVPPMHSALKHKGVRMYELARKGIEVERPPRRIEIFRFELTAFEPPRARFRVHCSKGTYVRSLVRDVGESLGCGAHLTALRRTQSGVFGLDQAVALDDVAPEVVAERLVSPPDAIPHVPAATVPADLVRRVRDGQAVAWASLDSEKPEPDCMVRLLTPDGALLALVTVESGRLRYARVFTYGLT